MGAVCPHFFVWVLQLQNVFLRKPWRWLTISKDMMVNEGIRAREVRLVGANGEQLGIKSRNEALELSCRTKS